MIRFPKMHIAKSVVNQILNVADEISPPASIDIPSIPEGSAMGTELDAKLSTPTPDVAAPDGLAMQDVMGPQSIL